MARTCRVALGASRCACRPYKARATRPCGTANGASARGVAGSRCAARDRARSRIPTQMRLSMDRRTFLMSTSAMLSCATLPAWASVASPRLLILIELRGGNDGLNTVIAIDDGAYFDLRPRLAFKPDAVARFEGAPALHPSLAPLEPLWRDRQMAILQGIGYPAPNLSHFRSIEIWDTASDSQQVLQTGWLTRTVDKQSAFASQSADGVVIGAVDLGPLAGGARAVALNDPARFARQARLASADSVVARGALAHVLRVENDIVRAGADVRSDVTFKTDFPRGAF